MSCVCLPISKRAVSFPVRIYIYPLLLQLHSASFKVNWKLAVLVLYSFLLPLGRLLVGVPASDGFRLICKSLIAAIIEAPSHGILLYCDSGLRTEFYLLPSCPAAVRCLFLFKTHAEEGESPPNVGSIVFTI